MRGLLLDTQIVLWWFGGSSRLRDDDRRSIRGASGVHVSAATVWEVGIKQAAGKLEVPEDTLDAVRAERFGVLDITAEDCRAAAALPRIHGDPFDRMLVAQAAARDLVLMTADRQLVDYPVSTRLV